MPAPGSHIPGWMTEEELQWLYETARSLSSVVEIGSWLGRSTYALCASGCPHVWAVDHFKGSEEQQEELANGLPLLESFVQNVGHFENLHIMPVSSYVASKVMERSFDLVFIDGAHDAESVKMDILLWAPRAFMLAGHDVGHAGVKEALNETLGPKGFTRGVGSLWIRRDTR